MANIFSPSANDPAVYTSNFPLVLTDGDGKNYNTVIKTNVNGNYDVYSRGTGLLGGDELIYQYNATTNVANFNNGIFKDKPTTAYNSFFKSSTGTGPVFNKQVKRQWYAEAPPNAATRLATLNSYKSIANTVQARDTGSTDPAAAQALADLSGNGDQQSGDNGGNTSEPTYKNEEFQALVNEGITGVGIKENYGNLRYPEKMTDMDCVVFTARQYSTRGFNAKNTGFANIETRIGKTLGTAALSIQPSLRDTNTVKWSGLEMSIFDQAFADLSLSTMSGGGEGARAFIDRALNTVNTEGENFKNSILTKLAESAVGTQGLLSRLTGAVFNPNLELLFQGPDLRTFNFNFNLSPRNETEAAQVKAIINFFKRNMAVQRTPAELFLKAPNVFEIKYTFAGRKDLHPSLNRIKFCALTSCSVDYTPSNSYMTFNDGLGTPVQYNLSMTFQELEPVFEDEYEGHNIGY